MKKLSPNELIGRRLKRNIHAPSGLLLLSESVILQTSHLDKLLSHNIELTEEDVDLVRYPQTAVIDITVKEMEAIFFTVRETEKLPIREVAERVLPVVLEQSYSNHNLVPLLLHLQSKDDYTYRHNIAVGIIATLIGRWLNYSEEEIVRLSLSALLHDIGKALIPLSILTKPESLTEEEYTLMKQHTVLGYRLIVSNPEWSDQIALVALQHHERLDGSGYPNGLHGEEMDRFSRIVAIADVFHAMTSQRVYKDATPFFKVLAEMRDHSFGKLDPAIMSVFMSRILDTLIGCEAELSDGTIGQIVMFADSDPTSPLLKVGDYYVNLAVNRQLKLERIISNP